MSRNLKICIFDSIQAAFNAVSIDPADIHYYNVECQPKGACGEIASVGPPHATRVAPVTGGNYNNGSLNNTGNGNWWSATANNSNNRYNLNYNGSSLNTNNNNRNNGNFVRCIRSS